MRTLVKVQIPVEGGNKAITSGTLPQVLNNFLEKHKPEAAYFGSEDGIRTAYMVIDVKEPSQIPQIAEPFFMELNASVLLIPVMNAADLKTGLAALAK